MATKQKKDQTTNNICDKDSRERDNVIDLKIPFCRVGICTVSLPFLALLFCFWTAVFFQYEQVNLTVCKVCICHTRKVKVGTDHCSIIGQGELKSDYFTMVYSFLNLSHFKCASMKSLQCAGNLFPAQT